MPTTETVIEYGKISQYLCANDIAKRSVFSNGSLDTQWPLKLNIVWESLENTMDKDPTNEYIIATKNFLYSLCGKWLLEASTIVGNSGGEVIEPPTGLSSIIVAIREQFTVGDVGALMVQGQTVLTLNYADVLVRSVSVEKDTVPLPVGLNNQQSFSVAYNPTNIVITFNEAVQDGQLFVIRGLRYINT